MCVGSCFRMLKFRFFSTCSYSMVFWWVLLKNGLCLLSQFITLQFLVAPPALISSSNILRQCLRITVKCTCYFTNLYSPDVTLLVLRIQCLSENFNRPFEKPKLSRSKDYSYLHTGLCFQFNPVAKNKAVTLTVHLV